MTGTEIGMQIQDDDSDDEAFLRSLVLPEEDRRRLTTAPSGYWRWFRSPNVIDLVRYRRNMTKTEKHEQKP
jgi:hypothetical protein